MATENMVHLVTPRSLMENLRLHSCIINLYRSPPFPRLVSKVKDTCNRFRMRGLIGDMRRIKEELINRLPVVEFTVIIIHNKEIRCLFSASQSLVVYVWQFNHICRQYSRIQETSRRVHFQRGPFCHMSNLPWDHANGIRNQVTRKEFVFHKADFHLFLAIPPY